MSKKILDSFLATGKVEAVGHGGFYTHRYFAVRVPFTPRAVLFAGLRPVGFVEPGKLASQAEGESYGRLYGCSVFSISSDWSFFL
jgi:hypothetical protein